MAHYSLHVHRVFSFSKAVILVRLERDTTSREVTYKWLMIVVSPFSNATVCCCSVPRISALSPGRRRRRQLCAILFSLMMTLPILLLSTLPTAPRVLKKSADTATNENPVAVHYRVPRLSDEKG